MGRPDGFLWIDPGIPSLTVPYHDTNDFFFSGHIGTVTLYAVEYYANNMMCGFWTCIFIGICLWIHLTVSRTHYIIDLVTGLAVAHWAHINAEWLTFYWDVRLIGLSRHQRKQYAHSVCHKCGWSND